MSNIMHRKNIDAACVKKVRNKRLLCDFDEGYEISGIPQRARIFIEESENFPSEIFER